jgi:PAS domain S-box-containing protein
MSDPPRGFTMQRRYDALLEHARDIILFIGRDGRILEANQAAARAYGYAREELATMHIRDLRAPSTHLELAGMMARALREGTLFETEHQRKDGSIFPVEVSSQSISPDGELLVSVIRDITERRKVERELRDAHAELEGRVQARTQDLEEANRTLAAQLETLAEARRTIDEQARAILEQSTPVLSLWAGLLLAPLIGVLDAARIEQLTERLLAAVSASSARVVLLDVTGVPTLDGASAASLLRVVQAVRLLGAEVIVTGMRASAARELASHGEDLRARRADALTRRRDALSFDGLAGYPPGGGRDTRDPHEPGHA